MSKMKNCFDRLIANYTQLRKASLHSKNRSIEMI